MNEPDKKVEAFLNDLGIPFELIEHPPAFTTEEADRFIEGIEGARTKSMFLTNKKKTAFYLLIMDDARQLDMNAFKEIVETSRIKMASPDALMEKLKLTPGAVSIFGLLNNTNRDVQVYFTREVLSEARMSFHPNINTKTLFLDTQDVLAVVEALGYTYTLID
ncbi:prolyl-tRNA synthetase associated domain-containing protein [Enterococcus sp. BWR-S5]|uniref:prolyl-tRNA synthetase associated domain-containing protein n=1 Tax=Enterococcus sp. BWR-S5 TaxID=2787714 RepID=UPI001921462A|nr:prolyl-tRNA synthetase associated domain-containing protein [Enterococcus sp. BWR-S5]MBL1225733.1 prolyl-tRNA synthetase associated domain-containing protein [Enterococcus sp. BWR-S5]